MSTMKVTLDGTIIEVPSRKVEIKSREVSRSPRPSTFIDEPLPHPDYDFVRVIGGVLASPKRT